MNAFTEVTESVVELESTGSLCRLCAVLLSQTNSWIKMKANKFYIKKNSGGGAREQICWKPSTNLSHMAGADFCVFVTEFEARFWKPISNKDCIIRWLPDRNSIWSFGSQLDRFVIWQITYDPTKPIVLTQTD